MGERDYHAEDADKLRQKYGWLYPAAAIVAVSVGYGIGLASSLWIGAAAALVLLVAGDYVWARIWRRTMCRRFPDLRDVQEWRYKGWFVRWPGRVVHRRRVRQK